MCSRLSDGLRVLNVLDTVRGNAEVARALFVSGETVPLTAEIIEELFVIEHSAEEGNRRRDEEKTLYQWRNLLLDMEGIYKESVTDFRSQHGLIKTFFTSNPFLLDIEYYVLSSEMLKKEFTYYKLCFN